MMAEKRMISKIISISEKVNLLPDIFDMLLFTWMIPHTDDFGRLVGSPAKVKALVVPMLDKSVSDVKAALGRLSENGLILWYEVDGERVIQIENFEKHQQGLHKRTKSKFPDFPGSSGKSQEVPSEGKGTKENRTEEKGREQISPNGDSGPNPYQLYENGFGTISSVISDNIDDLSKEYGNLWVCEAMRTAILRGKRNLKYVHGILKSWQADGIDEPWKEETSREESQRRDQGSGHRNNQAESEFAFLDKQNRTGTG